MANTRINVVLSEDSPASAKDGELVDVAPALRPEFPASPGKAVARDRRQCCARVEHRPGQEAERPGAALKAEAEAKLPLRPWSLSRRFHR